MKQSLHEDKSSADDVLILLLMKATSSVTLLSLLTCIFLCSLLPPADIDHHTALTYC